jgi:hypothetical protein
LIADALDRVHFDEELIEITYLAALERDHDTLSYSEAIRERLLRRLEGLDTKEAAAFDSFSEGVLSKPIYELKVSEIKRDRIALTKEVKEFKRQNPLATLEPTKEIFMKGSRAKSEYLTSDDIKKRNIATSILWNLSVQNQRMAQVKYKPIYQILADAPKTNEISTLLPDLDSNQDTRLQRAMSYH